MDRIADQVAHIEATVAKLRVDIDNILDAIKKEDGSVASAHAAYWRQLIDLLTALVLDADDRFNAPPQPRTEKLSGENP